VRVDCALLCDAATVREGLLNILGGGVTATAYETYPAPMPVTLALRVSAAREDISEGDHLLVVTVASPDGEGPVVGELRIPFVLADGAPPDNGDASAMTSFSVALPLTGFDLTGPGTYAINVAFDKLQLIDLTLDAT
jgi:hypothetical protein